MQRTGLANYSSFLICSGLEKAVTLGRGDSTKTDEFSEFPIQKLYCIVWTFKQDFFRKNCNVIFRKSNQMANGTLNFGLGNGNWLRPCNHERKLLIGPEHTFHWLQWRTSCSKLRTSEPGGGSALEGTSAVVLISLITGLTNYSSFLIWSALESAVT